jgi:hypothetical protein
LYYRFSGTCRRIASIYEVIRPELLTRGKKSVTQTFGHVPKSLYYIPALTETHTTFFRCASLCSRTSATKTVTGSAPYASSYGSKASREDTAGQDSGIMRIHHTKSVATADPVGIRSQGHRSKQESTRHFPLEFEQRDRRGMKAGIRVNPRHGRVISQAHLSSHHDHAGFLLRI